MRETIEAKLQNAFTPELLEVIDESERHRGHSGWREGGETHFRVRVVSAFFAGMSRVDRHRAINGCLGDELASSVHALAIEVRTPEEADPRTAKVTNPGG